MVELELGVMKDLGLHRQVLDALPTAVVGGAFDGSIWNGIAIGAYWELLNYVVPHGQQLKLLFLRVTTTDTNGALFEIVQTNPSAAGQTGTVEGFPVVGSVPPYTAGLRTVRDYPMLEAPGAEVLHGSLKDPIHVLEGSVDFRLLGFQVGPSPNRYGLTWWGVVETPEG
jgi:hypothetical protein